MYGKFVYTILFVHKSLIHDLAHNNLQLGTHFFLILSICVKTKKTMEKHSVSFLAINHIDMHQLIDNSLAQFIKSANVNNAY